MKKQVQLGLLLMISLVVFTSQLSAQDTQKEMLSLTKKYEEAYNKKDDNALKAMYTKDATRTYPDGTVNVGSEAIRAAMAAEFKGEDETTKITITPEKLETAADGTVTTTGSYQVTGKLKETGEAFNVKGTYTNTMVKENGKWKISKNVITGM